MFQTGQSRPTSQPIETSQEAASQHMASTERQTASLQLSDDVIVKLFTNKHGHTVAMLSSTRGLTVDVPVLFPQVGTQMETQELREYSKIPDAVFAMKKGVSPVFIAESRQGALDLARLAFRGSTTPILGLF
jgi:hypothetical protein